MMEPLLALQEIDERILTLKRETADLPRRRAAEENRLNEALKRQFALTTAGDGESGANQTAVKAIADEIADIRAFIGEIDDRAAEVKSELDGIGGRRAECAAKVDPEQLRLYERLAISHHPTIVRLDGNVCSGCHLTQPPAVAHQVRHARELVTCGTCGRILYC